MSLSDWAVLALLYLILVAVAVLAIVILPIVWLLYVTKIWTVPWEELRDLGTSIDQAAESSRLF